MGIGVIYYSTDTWMFTGDDNDGGKLDSMWGKDRDRSRDKNKGRLKEQLCKGCHYLFRLYNKRSERKYLSGRKIFETA